MPAVDLFLNYVSRSSLITLIVLGWLSIYFIITLQVFIARYFYLNAWITKEQDSLESMLMGSLIPRDDSILKRCYEGSQKSLKMLNVCKNIAEKNATASLALLSVIASTSPFIGLFGTVVSILETFSELGKATSASLNVIAPAISEALVATAGGIFVAIPAYSAHIILKRKGYEVMTFVQREIDLLGASKNYSKAEKENV